MAPLFRALCLMPLGLTAVLAVDAPSPFADKPSESYSGYKDDSGTPAVLLWGKAPLTDFGSRPVTFDLTGVRTLPQIPAPGVHPRICFGPAELPDIRARIKQTRCGQEAWKNILSWTEMLKGTYDDTAEYAKPDRWNGGFGGLRGRVPLFRLGIPREKGAAYVRHPGAAKLWASLVDGSATEMPDYVWNVLALEAFRALIDDDSKGAKTCAQAVATALKIDQAKRAAKPGTSGFPPAQPVGGFQLAFAYDFLFNQLTLAQKTALHDELAATTWSHDNYGTFNTAESSRSNWATFSYWLYQVLAIEGEPGFNDLKVRGMYRGWRNLLTYGWFQSGATFEGEAKNQLGMDGVILFSMRAKAYGFDNLSGHPYLQAYAKSFLPHSANAMLTGFHKYDLLGSSRAGKGSAAPMDALGLKYMFPTDPVIDWTYREAMGEDYSGIPDRPDGYFNALLFYAIYATDFAPGKNDPKKLNLGNTFFCGERALLMTRSAWEPTATQLNFHVRQANGGHPFSDRNAIMVAGAGRIWSPNGYASFRTAENSVVCIDGESQSEIVPGRLLDYTDQPQATFAVGDAKYCWDWNWIRLRKNTGYYTVADVKAGTVPWPPGSEPVTHTTNDFAFLKLPHAYLNRPMTEYGDWILPVGALSPYAREPHFPVQKAFRTAGLVRGPQPYIAVIDDIRKDDAPHRYDWTLALEYDLQIARIDHRPDGITDIFLTGADPDQTGTRPKEPLPPSLDTGTSIPADRPMLLVRVLQGASSGDLEPTIVELPNGSNPKKYSTIRRLIVPAQTVEPGFKVVLVPHRQGEALPVTTWNAAKTAVIHGGDTLAFTVAATGKTDLTITRGGTTLVAVTKPMALLNDPGVEARQKKIAALRQELAHFDPESLPGRIPVAMPEGVAREPGKVGQALAFTGAKEPLVLPVDLKTRKTSTITAWFHGGKETAGTILTSNGAKGLSVSIENGRTLRLDALGTNRWNSIPMKFVDWHHVAIIDDGATVTALVDGQVVKASPIATPRQLAPQLQIGGGFTGLIDDLRVYDRALTIEEATKLYQHGAFVAAPVP